MRYVLCSMSLLAAICSSNCPAIAQDRTEFQLMGYSQSADEFAEEGGDFEDFVAADPRYDWELSDGPADVNEFFAPPDFENYFQADILWLNRFHTPNVPIAVTLPPGSSEVLNSRDASQSGMYRPGALLTLGRRFDQVSAVELTFFGFNDWKNSSEVFGPSTLSLDGPLANVTQDYIFADRILIDYESSLYNVEGNYLQTISGLTLLTGFRYMRFNESFNIHSDVFALGSGSDYLVRAKNNLIGGQLGLGFNTQWDRLTVDLLGKFGVYANVAEQNTLMKDLNNTFVRRNFQDHVIATSVLGEAAVNGSYRIFDWLAVRAGYRFMWINNLALAPDQLNFNDAPGDGKSVGAHGYVYMHGGNAGVEIRW
jgi:hypothetical protein